VVQDTFGQNLGQDTQLTFKVGPAEPALYGPNMGFVTLDPASKKPAFSVYAINYNKLDVKIYAVQPSDWPAYKQYLQNYQRTDVNLQIPGRQVFNKTIPVEAKADTLTEVNIDLTQVMDGPFGHFIVIVSPPKNLFSNPQDLYWRTIQSWVQVTQIGLDAYTDHSQMVVWASALTDGKPLPGITVQATPTGTSLATGADGTARLDIPNGASYLVASQGADRALLPRSNSPWDDSTWSAQPVQDELRWYVFDDRQMYRPGEEVHFKGWLRRIGGGQNGDVGLVGGDVSGINYQITDSQGNAITSGQMNVNPLGGFDLAVTLPEKVNLGYTSLQLTATGSLNGMADYTQQFTH
ncbi:MAG TPA: MG2 domain-containing protein, partial [Candidatus Methylomirabilis sp.]|nr:MG2 domain-containing protein [Candidatus Methylomirabilis sp.]